MTINEPVTEVGGRTFESLNPATGQVIGRYPVHSAAEVREAVQRARRDAAWWAGIGFAERAKVLRAWRASLIRRSAEVVDLVHAENGKPKAEAMIEVILSAQHLDWAAKNARKVLGPRRVSSGMVMMNQSARLEYQPYGVIGALGPWNYPLFGPIGTLAYALAAGNAVVYKHSEFTPAVGEWLAASFRAIVGNKQIFLTVTGPGSTGEALCESGVDKIGFTGSPGTARKVLATCAASLTPAAIEAGGKDALVVDEDADLAAAADAAVWGGLTNAGQTCVGVERVYVHERVYDAFLREVTAAAKDLEAGEGKQLGPITMPRQIDIIRRHITDAVTRGGRALLGGPHAVGERYVQPTILVDVPEDSEAVREETFGPTLTIAKVKDMDEAMRKVNGTGYGLGGAVFSRSRGMELARRMRSGMTSVNSVVSFAGVPSLPYGGVGESGFGRIHGPDGLREFARPKSITRQRFTGLVRTTTFRRRPVDDRRLAALARLLYGRG